MKICCICNTRWKDSKSDKDVKKASLIYGCAKCNKGNSTRYCNEGVFLYGEFVKPKKD